MGFSPKHSTLVGLILKLRTQSITPQYHVVFDDTFSSVHSNNPENPRMWEKLITSSSAQLKVTLDPNEDPELDDEWLTREKPWPEILSSTKRHLEILEPHQVNMERLPLQTHLYPLREREYQLLRYQIKGRLIIKFLEQQVKLLNLPINTMMKRRYCYQRHPH